MMYLTKTRRNFARHRQNASRCYKCQWGGLQGEMRGCNHPRLPEDRREIMPSLSTIRGYCEGYKERIMTQQDTQQQHTRPEERKPLAITITINIDIPDRLAEALMRLLRRKISIS